MFLTAGMIATALLVIASAKYREAVVNATVVYTAEAYSETAKNLEEQLVEIAEPKTILVEVEWSKESIEKKIRKTFPETPNTAVAVAKGESGPSLKSDAYNPEPHRNSNGEIICYGSYGVMQVACIHMPDNPEALFDVETNLRVARQVYNASLEKSGNGWLPWGAYTSGGWKKFL